MKSNPLVSCICVTKNRAEQLSRSIKLFKLQTYRNKQLVIVYEDTDMPTEDVVMREHTSGLKLIKTSSDDKLSLGALRNLGIRHADGKYICQWDDDDWYHIGRLELQQAIIEHSGMQGCILSQWIIFDEYKRKAYISVSRLWEGSVMCDKTLFLDYKYANKKKGEDSDIISRLFLDGKLFLIEDFPNLYIYNVHGNNTWSRRHFEYYFKMSQGLNEASSNHIAALFCRKRPFKNDSYLLDSMLNKPIFTSA